MDERSQNRLVAWDRELSVAHDRLRHALRLVRESLADEGSPGRDLLLYCHGFCAALTGHHLGEDSVLFPALDVGHPELGEVIAQLRDDHGMIAYLLLELDHALRAYAPPEELARHLDGIGAIMESHFGYEERRLLPLLARLELDADISAVLGPL